MDVQTFYSKVPFNEDRFAEAIEMRPTNYAVVHHANIHFVELPPGRRWWTAGRWAPMGKLFRATR